MMKRRLILFVIFLLGLCYQAQAQCAMCRATLITEDGGNKAEGINNGIVYLMAFPYILVALVGFAIYRIMKDKKQKKFA
ncbi:hypothetical protein [Avrilella dinanensis]|uniref:hypothetical protein n=1 Tax=Avrilella dinanensis TaxID=2008672 RepID=UPI00240A2323|nr:hypothetical protein [Avrilella dinanensis]